MPGGSSQHDFTVRGRDSLLIGFIPRVPRSPALPSVSAFFSFLLFSHFDQSHPVCEYSRPIIQERPNFLKFVLQVKLDYNSPLKSPFLGDRKEVWGEIRVESYLNAPVILDISDFLSSKEYVHLKSTTPKVLFLKLSQLYKNVCQYFGFL